MASDHESGSGYTPAAGTRPVLGLILFLLVYFPWLPVSACAGEDPPDGGSGNPATIALDFYQQYLSSLRNTSCRFKPSCSEYARQAIARYGLFSGSARAADRLMRCNASAGHYYGRTWNRRLDDPVEETPHGRVAPRLPTWLLPAFEMNPPEVILTEDQETDQETRIEETVSFARMLAVEGDCWRAETEYLRAAHLSNSPGWGLWAQFQIGACYFEAGAWAKAEKSYLQVGMLAQEPGLRATAGHLLAASQFNGGRYREGEYLLVDPQLTSRALGVRGLCRMARAKWDAAAVDFLLGQERAEEPWLVDRMIMLEKAAARGPELPSRSPGLAMFMSTILPGSGQMYSGRVHTGIRHLIFNGILIFTVVKLIQEEHYPAAVGVGAIGIPFYVGNIRGGRNSAREFNRDRRLELVTEAVAETTRGSPE